MPFFFFFEFLSILGDTCIRHVAVGKYHRYRQYTL